MKTLLVHCHPDPESFNAALFCAACDALQSAGNEVTTLDLYAERFDPVLSLQERRAYVSNPDFVEARVQKHVDALRAAEHLVFVHPTWWYGPPAVLKGWLERVWLPGVAFTPPARKGQITAPGLQHVRRLTVVTTGGAPWWFLKVIGDPHRKLFTRGLRVLMAKKCKVTWLQMHNMNDVDAAERARFLAKVSKRLLRLT
jgi:putative NADPH-quinone reductase